MSEITEKENTENINEITENENSEYTLLESVPNEEKEPQKQPQENRDFSRCNNCNRKTNGTQDYINKKNGKITKTCIKCRTSVKNSLAKIKEKKKIEKPLKLSECVNTLLDMMKRADIELNEEEQTEFIKVLNKINK